MQEPRRLHHKSVREQSIINSSPISVWRITKVWAGSRTQQVATGSIAAYDIWNEVAYLRGTRKLQRVWPLTVLSIQSRWLGSKWEACVESSTIVERGRGKEKFGEREYARRCWSRWHTSPLEITLNWLAFLLFCGDQTTTKVKEWWISAGWRLISLHVAWIAMHSLTTVGSVVLWRTMLTRQGVNSKRMPVGPMGPETKVWDRQSWCVRWPVAIQCRLTRCTISLQWPAGYKHRDLCGVKGHCVRYIDASAWWSSFLTGIMLEGRWSSIV